MTGERGDGGPGGDAREDQMMPGHTHRTVAHGLPAGANDWRPGDSDMPVAEDDGASGDSDMPASASDRPPAEPGGLPGGHNRSANDGDRSTSVWRRALEINPWWYMGCVLVAILALMLLGTVWPAFYDRLVGPYLWGPILYDEGFNPINTLAFVLLAAASIMWFAGLMRHHGVHFDMSVEAGVIAWLAWGASIRVLEDADMHAPFASELVAAGLPAQTSCAPGLSGHWLTDCAGAFFITPIVWIWPALLMFVAARVSLASQRFDGAARSGSHARRLGLAHYAGSHLALLLAYALLAASRPAWLRFTAPLWVWLLGAAAAVALVAWRRRSDGQVRWSWGFLGFSFPLLASSAYAVVTWLYGTVWDVGPGAAHGRPIVLLLFLVGPAVLAGAFAWHARTLARARRQAGVGVVVALALVALAEAGAVFLGMVSAIHGGLGWLGAAVTIAAGHLAVGTIANRWGSPPGMARMATIVPALMLWGQLADALTTAVGIDVFHAGEKHLVPRIMIAWAAAADLPGPLGAYPTAAVLIPYKLGVTVLAAWYLETRTRVWLIDRPDLYLLTALAVTHVGIAPAIRNALRLTMGV